MRNRSVTALLLITSLVLAACGGAADARVTLAHSEFAISPLFTDYYAAHNGLKLMGFAIGPETVENGVRVQYFQNARLEYRPQRPEGQQVIPSSLGQQLYGGSPTCLPPQQVAPGALYFAESCHSVSPQFRPFFENNGGLLIFGYPISEAYIVSGRYFVQIFERAVIVWDSTRPVAQQFQLANLGSRACPPAQCTGSSRSNGWAPPLPSPTAQPTQANVLSRFYEVHGGVPVWGPAMSEPRIGADGALEQVFANGILYENPSAPEGVSVRPLGLKALGGVEPAVAQTDDANSIYFYQTGHNVAPVISKYYQFNGGVSAFGQPVSELRPDASGELVQYFENVAMALSLNQPADQAVHLLNLGQQTLETTQSAPSGLRTTPVQSISVVSEPAHTILRPTLEKQVLKAWVYDQAKLPVSGATVIFTVGAPGSETKYVAATDSSGFAAAEFTVKSFVYGSFILYRADASFGGLTASASKAFVPWQSGGQP